MSEFKYACPVCGQHIKCDSSQAGTQMECPTCFQKINVPQAPESGESKFILTGTKVGERPTPKFLEASPIVRVKKFPLGALILILLICAAMAVLFVYRGKIFKIGNTNAQATGAGQTSAPGKYPSKPAPVAPQANDENWMLNLDTAIIPNSQAAGRIQGQNFIVGRAQLQNGILTLREGTSGPLQFAIQIDFNGALPDTLAGQSINVATNAAASAPITMYWTENGQTLIEKFQGGYAMQLEFARISANHIRGKIYFCAPDTSKSYVAGTFNASIRKSRPKTIN